VRRRAWHVETGFADGEDGVVERVEHLAGGADGLEVVAELLEASRLGRDGVAHLLGEFTGLVAGATAARGHRTTSTGAVHARLLADGPASSGGDSARSQI
jgi:hypothetical protein